VNIIVFEVLPMKEAGLACYCGIYIYICVYVAVVCNVVVYLLLR
jgi:hypothetical protein